MLEIVRSHGAHAREARGVAIVIDVIRAFSVAAYAFAGGAEAIWLVRTVEEAVALREYALTEGIDGRPLEHPPLLAGEIGGRLIPGFDLNNSPSRMMQTDVRGRLIIQRTGAGTQGAANALHAERLLMCSLVNAQATASYAR
ncbi:MAG TPA: 2-phosphosulfolactate phosphatase, partial [Ktedonobacterales bacterium]|nr:2-phosphosulfolactate phosphatase [Ktedonobacterales bacterium]